MIELALKEFAFNFPPFLVSTRISAPKSVRRCERVIL